MTQRVISSLLINIDKNHVTIHCVTVIQTYVCFTLTYCTVCTSSESAGIKKQTLYLSLKNTQGRHESNTSV